MKKSQSKFSNKKAGMETSSHPNTKSSGCCCGSKLSEEVDEIEIIDEEDK